MDLIFYLFVTPSWMATEANNSVWNGLKGMHGFAIFCSVIITILKVYFIVYIVTFSIFPLYAKENTR